MRSSAIVTCAVIAVGVAGCGGGDQTAASVAAPPQPIAVSALIGPGQVAVSPDRLGAGPILLTVTNQASRAEALVIRATGSSRVLARTAPINPQGSTQINVDPGPGSYVLIAAAAVARTDAQRSRQTGAPAATLRIGARRRGGGAALLTP